MTMPSSISRPASSCQLISLPRLGAGFGRLAAATGMSLERPRRRKLAQLVSHHVLGHVHRNKLLAIVHGNGVAHKFGKDRRTPRPGLDYLLVVGLVQHLDLYGQVRINERALLCRTCHKNSAPSSQPSACCCSNCLLAIALTFSV